MYFCILIREIGYSILIGKEIRINNKNNPKMMYYSEGVGEILLDNKMYVCDESSCYGPNVCVPIKLYFGDLTSNVTILE